MVILYLDPHRIFHDPVPSLLKRWMCMETGIDLSAEILDTLNKRFKTKTKRWLKEEKHAQSKRHEDPTAMDIYDTVTSKGIVTLIHLMCSILMSIYSSFSCRNTTTAHIRG